MDLIYGETSEQDAARDARDDQDGGEAEVGEIAADEERRSLSVKGAAH